MDSIRYNKALPYMNQLENLVNMDIDEFSSMKQDCYEYLLKQFGEKKMYQAEMLLDQVANILWGE